jgi:pimeloyl-ACP methyl ester carboxylesterase
MQDAYLTIWGSGKPVVLVHGSGDTDPAFVWQHQRSLSDRYQLLLLTRPGYGTRPIIRRTDVEQDVGEVLSVLTTLGGAHLVGYSYGGCIALLAAAREPQKVLSLTVVEPPAFAVARGDRLVEERIRGLELAYDEVDRSAPEVFLRRFMAALGQELPDPLNLPPGDLKGIEAMQAEPAPWRIEIPLAQVEAAKFPRLVVSGNWDAAFEVVADVLTHRLSAQRVVCSGMGHYILDLGHHFNQQLDTFISRRN